MIVIATRNEENNIWSLLDKLRGYQVLLVDDSDDATPSIARRFNNVEVVKGRKRGIADAYLLGLDAACRGTDWVLQMDAGFTHDPADVNRILKYNSDLVIGARQFSLKSYRTLISMTAAKLMDVSDATNGFRLWKSELLQKMDFENVTSKGFAFQLELLHMAKQLGASIAEMPIEYKLTNSSFKASMLLEAARVYVQKGMWK